MAWKLNFSHYFLCSRREPAVGWPMTWMLESRRNFLINFRDCFSIKLFMFVCHPQNKKKSSNAIPVSGPEFQSTFATCNCTLGDFEAYLRCATMRQSPDSANRPQKSFSTRFPCTGTNFRFYVDIGYKIIYTTILFLLPYVFAEQKKC